VGVVERFEGAFLTLRKASWSGFDGLKLENRNWLRSEVLPYSLH